MAGEHRRAARAHGRRPARTRTALTLAVLAAGAAGALGACGSGAEATFRPITLRAVESDAPGSCTLAPLTGDEAGSACDASGTRTYSLGPALGDLRIVHAAADGPRLQVQLDESGRTTLADVTGRLVGQRLALVVDGVVLGAPTVAEPLETPDLALGASSDAEADGWLGLLSASPAR